MAALECPNCGAVHEPSNPGIVVIVCDRCDSTLYLEDDVLRQGERSVVGEPRSNVAVGQSGRIGDIGVEVIGRVRLSHDRGAWDEWYVRTAEGRERWLIEDEKDYAFEDELPTLPEGAHPDMGLGDAVYVNGVRFEVREHGFAVCKGGEGQLPRNILPGETYRYADLIEIGGSRVLSIEFDPNGEGEAYLGRAIDASRVQFKGARAPSAKKAVTASTITCAGCGAPFMLPTQGDAAETAACPNCDAVLELDGAENAVVGYNQEKVDFHLQVGARGELVGETWEVVGRMRFVDDEGYWHYEYLLWAKDAGYLWLVYDSGHYSYNRPLEQGLSLGTLERAGRGTKISVGGTTFFLMSRGYGQLTYVDGALPWEARHGDQQKNWDLAAPPELLSVEAGDNELEVFRGAWLPPGTVEKAFGLKKSRRPWAVHFAQPNPWAGFRAAAFAAILICALNILIVMLAGMWPGHDVVTFTIPSSTTGTQFVESQPFVLDPGLGPIMGVQYDTEVDNSWVYIDLELGDAITDESVGAVGQEVGYYHGYDDGHWTEGSRTETQWMRVPPKGTYTLSGTLEYDRSTAVRVTVKQGGMLSRYNGCLTVPFGLAGGLLLFAFFRFEHQRVEDA